MFASQGRKVKIAKDRRTKTLNHEKKATQKKYGAKIINPVYLSDFCGMFEPVPLNFPAYPFRIKEEAGKTYIFDELRKRFLVLTPEEWVRQHLVRFLIEDKKYPRSLIKLEGGLKLNTLQKRSDILLFNTQGHKTMLAECKAPSVKITQETFDQVARYNFVHRVPWLLVSNGLRHFCCELDLAKGSYRFREDIPGYPV